MNPDFVIHVIQDHGCDDIVYVEYKGVRLAKFVDDEKHEQLAEWRAEEYIEQYGYMAEYRRRWLLKQFEPGTTWVNWSEDLRVTP